MTVNELESMTGYSRRELVDTEGNKIGLQPCREYSC
jgi:hypothetical protein